MSKSKSSPPQSRGNQPERRRRPRARIEQKVRVRPLHLTEAVFDEVRATFDVSREGLYFPTKLDSYSPGMRLAITIPYEQGYAPIAQDRTAEVVRVTPLPDGGYGIAVRYLPSEVGKLIRGANPENVVEREGQTSRRHVVLCVDKDPADRRLVSASLDNKTYEVVPVGSCEQALEELRFIVPALVIAEIAAPCMSGLDLCAIAKRDERLRDVPFVLLAEDATAQDYANARAMGAAFCLTKPLKAARVAEIVNQLVANVASVTR